MSSYDQNLLGEAPKATRAQLQQGYSVDLLEQPAQASRRTSSLRSPTPHISQLGPVAITVPSTPVIAENGSGEKFDSPAPPKPKLSFWRTRNGIISIVALTLIIIGAVVGGAVGGTVGKKSTNITGVAPSSSRSSPATTLAPTTTATQDAGSQPSASQQIAGSSIRQAETVTTTTTTSRASPSNGNIG